MTLNITLFNSMSRLILGTATFITLGGMAPEIVQAFPVILAGELDRNHVESARMGLEALNNENYSIVQAFPVILAGELDRNHVESARMGLEALNNENYSLAFSLFNTSLLVNPDYAEAYAGRAEARARLGDLSGTISDLEQAARLFQEQGNTATYNQVQQALQQIR